MDNKNLFITLLCDHYSEFEWEVYTNRFLDIVHAYQAIVSDNLRVIITQTPRTTALIVVPNDSTRLTIKDDDRITNLLVYIKEIVDKKIQENREHEKEWCDAYTELCKAIN